MSWCGLTSDNERSAMKISGLRPSDDGAKRYQNFAALLIFTRRTTISHFSFLISNSNESFKGDQEAARPVAPPPPIDFLSHKEYNSFNRLCR